MVYEEVKRKQLTYQMMYDFSTYERLKNDLQQEICNFLTISLNMHTVSCLRLLGIQGFHTDPNAYAGDHTNFSLSIAEAENIQSEAIHNAQQGGLNREITFIWLEAEINGRRVTEATGI